jgi:hypothetical protein
MEAANSCTNDVYAEIEVGSAVDPGSVQTCQDFTAACGALNGVCADLRDLALGSADNGESFSIAPVVMGKRKRGLFG